MWPCSPDRSPPGRSTSLARASWCSATPAGAWRDAAPGSSSARALALPPRLQPNLDPLAGDRLGGEGVLGRDRGAIAEQAALEADLVALEGPAPAMALVAAAHRGVGAGRIHPQLGRAPIGIG